MTEEFIQRDGLEGWVNEDGAWIKPPKQIEQIQPKQYPVDLQALTADLIGTPLFNQLNEYYKASPALTIYLGDGVLTEAELPKLLAQLDIDLGEQRLTQGLYDVITVRINTIVGENNE